LTEPSSCSLSTTARIVGNQDSNQQGFAVPQPLNHQLSCMQPECTREVRRIIRKTRHTSQRATNDPFNPRTQSPIPSLNLLTILASSARLHPSFGSTTLGTVCPAPGCFLASNPLPALPAGFSGRLVRLHSPSGLYSPSDRSVQRMPLPSGSPSESARSPFAPRSLFYC
jgi:hypothetical protein